MSVALTLREFAIGWLPAMSIAATSVPPAPHLSELFIVPVFGVPVPVVTCALGALGIALARPFARRSEAQLGWGLFALVTLIMLIAVQLWIVEARPGWLFVFVVAIGMGFSGYSLLELFGDQVKDFTREIFDKARETIGARKTGDKE